MGLHGLPRTLRLGLHCLPRILRLGLHCLPRTLRRGLHCFPRTLRLGLHCLPRSQKRDAKHKYVNMIRVSKIYITKISSYKKIAGLMTGQ